jgi:hypothetical protein
VKHKRVFSLFLICLTLLTSMQFVSYFGYDANVHPGPAETQFIADSQEVSPEFRESHEFGILDEIRVETGHAFQKFFSFDSATLIRQRFVSFQQECLSKGPCKKLFISFGALII